MLSTEEKYTPLPFCRNSFMFSWLLRSVRVALVRLAHSSYIEKSEQPIDISIRGIFSKVPLLGNRRQLHSICMNSHTKHTPHQPCHCAEHIRTQPTTAKCVRMQRQPATSCNRALAHELYDTYRTQLCEFALARTCHPMGMQARIANFI